MKTIEWVVGLLSQSAYGIGNAAFAYPTGQTTGRRGPGRRDRLPRRRVAGVTPAALPIR